MYITGTLTEIFDFEEVRCLQKVLPWVGKRYIQVSILYTFFYQTYMIVSQI